jgi:kumamolisin
MRHTIEQVRYSEEDRTDFNRLGRINMNALAPVRDARTPAPQRAWLAVMLLMSLSALTAHASGPGKPEALDLGPLAEQSATARMSVTVALRMRAPAEAENLLASLHTPGDPQYRHFLTAEQFAARFAPSAAEVAKVTTALARYGLTAERASALTLKVTGSPAAMERAFGVTLHAYHVAASRDKPAYNFHAPLSAAVMPAEVAGSASVVLGLDSRPSLRPHLTHASHPRAHPVPAGALINAPGSLTVADFASWYHVQPLYKRGVTGKGRTLGIVTLAGFTPSDVFAYWSAVGLKVDNNRLSIVNIDGGPGAPSDAAGSLESTLDVEQSGGLAPGARIIVYLAPNTNQAFLDAFVQAVEDNRAQSVSTSWGFWEWFQNLDNSPVTDPLTGQTTGLYQAMHEQFVRAAIQGQSLFSASGDGGAYDANHDVGCFPPFDPTTYSCTLPLTVDYPGSDPAMTAGGGTTLPGLQQYCQNAACTPPFLDINVPNEQVWGWDYLTPLCGGADPISCGIFPVGSGGGVSVFFPRPSYQNSLHGVRRSEEDQVWRSSTLVAAAIGITDTHFRLPGEYAGRNVPDVSFNADPQTGYVVAYTSSDPTVGFSFQTFWGGTSFVGPQLNGLTALFGQRHGRLGLLNYSLYRLESGNKGDDDANPPLHPVRDGDNWFYHGSNGYNPAAGLGIMDVASFDATLPGREDE